MIIKNIQKNKETERLLLLDWDGTLLNNLALQYVCVSKVFERYSVATPTLEEYRREIDVDFMKFFYARGVPTHITIEEVRKILKETRHEYYNKKENPLRVALREDAVSVLSRCRELGIKTAVISAETPEALDRGLSQFNAKPLLDYYRGLAFQKDSAILETCALFNIQPAYTFYVDDLANGIESAKKTGVTVCGMMNNGHNAPERILNAHPDFLVDSLTEVLEIIIHGELDKKS
ncbi:MAG: HAD hydrolase-like protein [Patescibacteria group bacterium]